jgi:ferritin-like metal-binding protein YciE
MQETQVRESVVQDKLGDYIEDTLALEESVVDQLDSMIGSVERSPALMEMLQRHRQVNRLHVERLKSRLERLGRGTPVRKRIEGMALTLIKSVSDVLRTDAQGKVGRDAFLIAQTQVAAYELLSRTASAAGDTETADLARMHLDEDKKCANEIGEQWDDFFQLTLAEWVEKDSERRGTETTTTTV